MNETDFPYVVLRNFENLPDNVEVGEHSDLDLLVYDIEHWMELFPDAERCYPHPRVRFKVGIGESYIYTDVRYVGDGYYPEDFQRHILNTREKNEGGFFTPAPNTFRIALAYHAVHHKGHNSYNRWLGDASLDDLFRALKGSNIGWVEPEDPTVGRFNAYWKGATSVVEKKDGYVKKTQTSFKGYDLLENEYRILSKVDCPLFPKVKKEGESIHIEDCGEQLTEHNAPKDWKAQLINILKELRKLGIQHRDIKPDNIMVKDGVTKLIDFGWARLVTDPEDNPPSCLGYPFKPSYGFDDTYSMKQVIKRLEYRLEENEDFGDRERQNGV